MTFVNKKGYNEYNNKDTLIVSCPNQMLAATLFAGYKCIGVQMLLATLLATNKCVGGQMLIKIYLFGGRFFVRNEKYIIEKIKILRYFYLQTKPFFGHFHLLVTRFELFC